MLKGSLLIALYSLRSDPGLCEQLRYNLLFRWFLDMDLTGEPPEASAFAMDRKRLVSEGASRGFFRRVITQARAEHLIGPEHFTVNEALLATWGTAERVTRAKALASLASAAPSDLVASTSTLPPGGTSMICRIGAAFEPTPRQTEILEGLSEGLANKELALRLGCSIRNVEYHVGQILRKAGYSSRLELVAQMWGRAPSRGTGSRTSAG